MADLSVKKVGISLLYREPETSYLMIDQLSSGSGGMVYRVRDTRTGQVCVRKVSHKRLTAPSDPRSPISPDREAAINFYIKENLPSVPGQQRRPNIAEVISQSIVQYHTAAADQPDKIGHALYFKYYNCGNLWRELNPSFSSRKYALSLRLMARLTHQVLRALSALYRMQIVHRDLNMTNIWVHLEPGSDVPDFYIGDFGLAVQLTPHTERKRGWKNPTDLSNVIEHIRRLIYRAIGSKEGDKDGRCYELWGIVRDLRAIHRAHKAWDKGPMYAPPPEALDVLADRAEAAEELYGRGDMPVELRHPEPAWPENAAKQFKPWYTRLDHLVSNGDHMAGPWYIAKVDMDTHQVLEVEDDARPLVAEDDCGLARGGDKKEYDSFDEL